MKFAFPRPAAKEPDPPGVTIPESLVKSAKLASWLAFFSLVYFLWLYTLDIAKDRAAALQLNDVGPFVGLGLEFWFPYIVGFGMVAVGIPYVAKIAIPVFMSLRWKGQFYPKLWSLFIAVAVSLVVIAGTFTVQGEAVMEKGRDSAVKVEQIGQERAAIQARIDSVQRDIDDLQGKDQARPTMQMMAAREGEIGWQVRIDTARAQDAPNVEAIERALSAAKAADALKAKRADLQAQLAAAPTVASVQQRVETTGTGWIGRTIDWLEGARAMLLALVMDLVCLVMPWIALRLEQARKAQIDAAGPQVATVDESFMIPDLRAQAPVTPQPMEPVMEAYDENGERLVFRKGHFAKKARRGKAKETDKPVPLSDTDPRVVRPLEAQNGLFDQPGNAGSPASEVSPEDGGAAQSGDQTADRGADGALAQPETQDLIAPPLSQEQAQELVDTGEYEWRGNGEDRWIERIQREAQQGAADEIVLADGQGVMKTERADG